MNEAVGTKTAIALFGSVARRDCDHLSDKDVLIVDDNVQIAKHLAREFRVAGWSPVYYSWRRLEAAARSKRLFIQHLRQDARILQDRDGHLNSILTDFRPRSGYRDELRDAEKFLRLPLMIPNCTRGFYWAADVLTVGLRNYGILKLAHEGIYRFNLHSILTTLVEIGCFRAKDISLLIGLREYKRMYRAGTLRAKLTFESVANVVNLVSDRIGVGSAAKKMSAEDTVRSALFPVSECEWYHQARRLEAALFAFRRSAKMESDHRCFETEVKRAVRSPADYGWVLKINKGRLSEQLLSLVNSCRLERW